MRSLKANIFLLIVIIFLPNKAAAIPAIDMCTIASSLGISAVFGWISSGVGDLLDVKTEGSEDYTGHQMIIASEIEMQKKAQTTAVAGTLKQHAVAEIVAKNNLIYSPLSQSSFACCEEKRAMGIVDGSRSLPNARVDIFEGMHAYNNAVPSPNQAYNMMSGAVQVNAFQNGKTIFTSNTTMSDSEVAMATYTGALLTNPSVDFEPPAKYLAKSAGQKYQTLRRLKQAKLSISQMAIADIISRRAPLYALQDWMNQMCRSIDIPQNPPEIVGGMISAETLLDMEVASRYRNPTYITDIHRKTKTGVVRELLAVEAINMEFNRLELVTQQYLTALQASRSATTAQQSSNEHLEREYSGSLIQAY